MDILTFLVISSLNANGFFCLQLLRVYLARSIHPFYLYWSSSVYCMYSTCTVHTVHVLYIQYMYCMYSTCFVGGMYFERTFFLRKMILKNDVIFLKIYNFPNCSKTMLTRTAPFLRSISMWKRLNLNFLDKVG